MHSKNPYPVRYIEPILLSDDTLVQLRPIHPVDGAQAEDLQEKLSPESIYDRFLGYIPKITPSLVKRMTDINYSKEMAIVAEVHTDEEKEIIAVARIASENPIAAEFAIIIADDWHGKGLGKIMTEYMIKIATDMGFEKVYALFFNHNKQMLEILKQRGFRLRREDSTTKYAELNLKEEEE